MNESYLMQLWLLFHLFTWDKLDSNTKEITERGSFYLQQQSTKLNTWKQNLILETKNWKLETCNKKLGTGEKAMASVGIGVVWRGGSIRRRPLGGLNGGWCWQGWEPLSSAGLGSAVNTSSGRDKLDGARTSGGAEPESAKSSG